MNEETADLAENGDEIEQIAELLDSRDNGGEVVKW